MALPTCNRSGAQPGDIVAWRTSTDLTAALVAARLVSASSRSATVQLLDPAGADAGEPLKCVPWRVSAYAERDEMVARNAAMAQVADLRPVSSQAAAWAALLAVLPPGEPYIFRERLPCERGFVDLSSEDFTVASTLAGVTADGLPGAGPGRPGAARWGDEVYLAPVAFLALARAVARARPETVLAGIVRDEYLTGASRAEVVGWCTADDVDVTEAEAALEAAREQLAAAEEAVLAAAVRLDIARGRCAGALRPPRHEPTRRGRV